MIDRAIAYVAFGGNHGVRSMCRETGLSSAAASRREVLVAPGVALLIDRVGGHSHTRVAIENE